MKDVLIIGERKQDFNLFFLNFTHLPIHFSWAAEIEQALKIIESEKPCFVFFISRDAETILQWLQKYHALEPDIPYLCFTGNLSWDYREMIWQTGAADLIQLPLNRREMEYILKAIILRDGGVKVRDEKNIEGSLADFTVIDLIQTFEDSRKNGIIRLQNGARKGEIEFNKGLVVNANYENRDPMESIKIMATWRNGNFSVKYDRVKHHQRIVLDNQQVILDCLNFIDMQDNLLKKLPAGDNLLYAAPGLDYEEMAPKDRNNLLKFKHGKNIRQFLDEYTGNTNNVLKKIDAWLNDKWLLTEKAYRERVGQKKQSEQKSGLQKLLKRIFSREEKYVPEAAPAVKSKDEILDEEIKVQVNKKPCLFSNEARLKQFAQALGASE